MDISIVIPYLSNSTCIELCKKLIAENTRNKYELVEIVDNKDVYQAFNDGVAKAQAKIVILLNDDMFVSPGWDENFLKYTKGKAVCTGYVVEPGVIGVSHKNIHKDFGHRPSTFKRFEFEYFVNQERLRWPEALADKKGWYMPISFVKEHFIPYPNEKKFPVPNDMELIDEILPKLNYKFLKVNSFIYHLQNFSSPDRVLRI